MIDQMVAVALDAYGTRQAAKIGVGWATDWDPNDEVYRDRRSENDELQPWGADGPVLDKDPHLGVVRFDTLDDEPLALMVNFGMHGILGSERNPLASTDSGGGLETGLEESYGDRPVVVMFTQGSGGDASPGGQQDDFARMETIGVLAAPKIRAVADAVRTSAAPIRMETASRSILKHPSIIEVTRDGAVDWRYAPFDPDPDFVPDEVVYGDNGEILSPIDEFNTETGGVFCGSGDLDFPIGGLAAEVFPYGNCLQVDLLTSLISVFFKLEPEQTELPLKESLRAGTAASRLGPLPTSLPDGSSVDQDLFVGFFPGEPVYSYGEQWRRRVADELGLENAMMVGYSQDHEGYLMIPEDWLVGGYEPDISLWGPLEGEHVMEGVLAYAKETLLTTDVREPVDPLGTYGPTTYDEVPLSTLKPDPTPDAGARITEERPYLWTPFVDVDSETGPHAPTAAELAPSGRVPRVQGMIQLAWEGGDPAVDTPRVHIERQQPDGSFAPLTRAAGRPIDESQHDILLSHTPTPLYPADAVQTHQWWAGWQAVGHWSDRTSLPLGTYRLRVEGVSYGGAAETWPWDTVPYEVVGDPFEIVPAEITVTEEGGTVYASLRAPEHGYRLIAMGGDFEGDNPVRGPVTVEIVAGDQTDTQQVDPTPSYARSALPVTIGAGYEDWERIVVVDADGNEGTLVRPVDPPKTGTTTGTTP